MERIDPEKILEKHIKNNPEDSTKMQELLDDNLAFYDENFDLKEADKSISEIMETISEDKEEIKSKQFQKIQDRYIEIEKKFLEVINNIKKENDELQKLIELRGNSEERTRRLDLNYMSKSEYDTNSILMQMTGVENSIENLSKKIKNKEINKVELVRELGAIMKTKEIIEGVLRPKIKDGEHLNRYEMN